MGSQTGCQSPSLRWIREPESRPSSSWISGAFPSGRWSNPFGLGSEGFPGTLEPNEMRFLIGIHCLVACRGVSRGSMVSISNGGGGGRGSWMMRPKGLGEIRDLSLYTLTLGELGVLGANPFRGGGIDSRQERQGRQGQRQEAR